jgi:CRP-like cAMP-binding protein
MSGRIKLAKGETLFKEGDPPDNMYVLKIGKLAVVKHTPDSKDDVVLAELPPGSMVGEMAFFDSKPRSATVKALKDCELIVLPYKALHAQFKTFPEWCKAIMRTVNNHLRNANAKIKDLERQVKGPSELSWHSINKLMGILEYAALKAKVAAFGSNGSQSAGPVVLDYGFLRDLTLQIYQEPATRMQKLLEALATRGILTVSEEEVGRKVTLKNLRLIGEFVSWQKNRLIESSQEEPCVLTDKELKLIKALLHFAKKSANTEASIRLNLLEIQAQCEAELGFAVKLEEFDLLSNRKIILSKHISTEGAQLEVFPDELQTQYDCWELYFDLAKIVG